MSLRLRLNLIIIIICLLGLFLGGAIIVINARTSVYEEVLSSLSLAQRLLGDDSVGEQLSTLENIRHLKISVVSSDNIGRLKLSERDEVLGVPALFVQFVYPDVDQLSMRLNLKNIDQSFQLLADPSDEITEAWDETLIFIAIFLLLMVFISVCVFIIIGRALRPVNNIMSAIEGIEGGHLDTRLAEVDLPEFNKISQGINHLCEKLSSSTEENRRMHKQSLNVRELERRYLARELHDEMGQSLSAIKALSVSVKQSKQVDKESLTKIESICDRLFVVIRNRMRQLSPPLLAEFGLTVSINELVDEWQGAADVMLTLDDNLDELADQNSIHLYRIIQEALTNVLKHAEAGQVSIQITSYEQSDDTCLFMSIKDDGVGFNPSTVKWGGGLVSIKERVDSLGGDLNIEADQGLGTTLSAMLKKSELGD
ncbi:MAG TPA: hypothetical protein EYG50_10180 [Cycloclasticus sp.]|jgi:two-component system sensor histidine kinase UhpB|nr:hypothetical protein [Cycloclasticus sp.]